MTPAEILTDVDTAMALLELLEQTPASLDWCYLHTRHLWRWEPQQLTGTYPLSGDMSVKDDKDESIISSRARRRGPRRRDRAPPHTVSASTSH